MDQRDSFDVNWSELLKLDGSLPYVPFIGTVAEAPVVTTPAKRSAVAPRPRHHDGIVVLENPEMNVGIVDAKLHVETRWTCTCGASFKKAGRHTGTLRTCRACGERYFLRMVPHG